MSDVGLHLGVSVRDGVGDINLIRIILELIFKAELVVGTLLLRVKVIYFFRVGGMLVTNVVAALLVPPSFSLLEVFVMLC